MLLSRAILHNPESRAIFGLGIAGIANALFNRIVMTKFFFDYPIVILMLQMATTLFGIEIARLFNWIKLPAYTFQRGKDMFLPSVLYALSTYLGMNCLDGIAMPLFPPILRLAPLAVILISSYFFCQPLPDRRSLLFVEILCVGAALSSFYELSVDAWSIIYGFSALTMYAVALVLIERLHEALPSTLDLVYMNSFNCLCIFLLADLVQDEIRDAFMYMITSMTGLFLFCLVALITIGSVFHIAVFHCVVTANALQAVIMQNIAGGLQIFVAYTLSVYLFYDLAPSWTNIMGMLVSVVAAIAFYNNRKFQESHATGSKFFMMGKA